MKIKSVSSSILVVACIGLGIFFYKYISENKEKTAQYHLSAWNEYRKQIDSIKIDYDKNMPIGLNHVYGLVVPHHIPTTLPSLTDYYGILSKEKKPKNIIIIGPDHVDAGFSKATISKQKFVTSYGDLYPYIEGVSKILETGVASVNEKVFDNEHSIGVQVLLISKFFPSVNILPIVIRSDITKEEASILGSVIGSMLNDETMLVASVDFSHYLSKDQALSLDDISGSIVRGLDVSSSNLVRADSGKSMFVFMQAMISKQAKYTSLFKVLNTDNFMQNSDYTTGYVFGFWGSK